ncbi:Uncharacterised protein [Delftia tsuruhatensis]|uniref:hypothetical protein n=1 Tax=Delftia tsuruhatensis TaxID=180282 RepID=UPI001E6B4FE6|nr:hypothetical protein [Delftia tsuruhatensis]CAB5721007.1 Uncharacterised protein [Delftia tsuruhatensis]CAC9688124.1 Uncharacterised protein [Delftia tsuruhatensis]
MKFYLYTGRSWFNEARTHKVPIVSGILAVISLSLAHYAGFLVKVPLQIVAVAGLPLAKSVTATFLFYVFLCAVIARVLTSMLQPFVLPGLALVDRLERGFSRELDFRRRRKFVREHSRTIRLEGYLWFFIQFSFFLLLMLAIYVKFAITWISGVGLIFSILCVLISGLIRSGYFLQPRLVIFLEKIKNRPSYFGRAASALFVTMTSALVVVAFFLGTMRASLLRDQEPQKTITRNFSGLATVIASSEGSLLLFQKQNKEFRYIYSTSEFTISIETSPIFSSIEYK